MLTLLRCNDDDTSKTLSSPGWSSHAKTTPIRFIEVPQPNGPSALPSNRKSAESQIVDIVRVVIHPIALSHLAESYLTTRSASSFWIPIKIIQHHLEYSYLESDGKKFRKQTARLNIFNEKVGRKSTEEIDQKI